MPLAAAIPAIIGAAGSIGGGLLASRQPSSVKNALNTETQIQQFGLGTAKQAIPQGLADLTAVEKYDMPLVTGDRQAMMEAEGPQISTLAKNYAAAKRQVSEFGPRGGGTASTLAQSQFSLSDMITNLLEQARTGAVSSLTDVGSRIAGIGTSAMGQAGGAAGTAGQIGLSQEQQTTQAMSGLGSGLAKIIGQLMNQGKTSGGGVNPDLLGISSNTPVAG